MEVIGDPQAVEPGLLRQARLADYFAGIVLFSVLIPGADCTTVFCAIIDPRSSTVRYSSAGGFPALQAEPDGTVRQLNHAMSPPLAGAADRGRPEAT